MPFRDTDEWIDALNAGSTSFSGLTTRNKIAREMSPGLTDAELDELIAISQTGSLEEKDTALRFLAPPIRSHDVRLEGTRSADVLRSLYEIVRAHYFDLPLGGIAWSLLWALDKPRAEEFITSSRSPAWMKSGEHDCCMTWSCAVV